MKRLPTSVRIKGIDWKVLVVPENHKSLETDDEFCNEGSMDFVTCTLYIHERLTLQAKWAVLWHEILHAISIGFRELDLTDEVPVECVSAEIFSVMRSIGLL